MAKFRNSRSGDVITVSGPLVAMYQAKAHWRRLPDEPPAEAPEDNKPEDKGSDGQPEGQGSDGKPKDQASKDPKKTTQSTRRRG